MKGVILYSSKYGSTAEYAGWIAEATGLAAIDVNTAGIELSDYDFLVLGSPVYYYKPLMQGWIESHLQEIAGKPVFFFTVSGAGAGPKLENWLGDSLPREFTSRMQHVALRGRMDPAQLGWFHRTMLKIGAMFNRDPDAREDEMRGFDYMDKSSIEPLVGMIRDAME